MNINTIKHATKLLALALTVSVSASVTVSGQGLTFVTHGMSSSGTETWVQGIKNGISAKTSSWSAVAYDWKQGADVLLPNYALDNAYAAGKSEADKLDFSKYNAIHFIAHSAGSRLIAEYAKELRARGYDGIIQITYLDAYTPSIYNPAPPSSLSALNFLAQGNTGANITEHYYSDEGLLSSWPFTQSPIPETNNNYDVTNKPNSNGGSHAWPHDYYLKTINDPNYDPGYGFALSIEQSAFAKMWVSVSGSTNLNTPQPGGGAVLSGPFTWYSGTVSGTLANFDTQFAISNSTSWSAPMVQNGWLVNLAAITQKSGATLTLTGGTNTLIANGTSSAVYELQGTAKISGNGYFLNNGGLVSKTGAGEAAIGSGIEFNNTGGTVKVSAGALTISGSGENHNGTFAIDSGAQLNIGGRYELHGDNQITGAGLLNVSGGIVSGSMGGDTLRLTGGTLNISTGSVSVSNYAQGAGATLNLTAGASPSLIISGSASLDGKLNISGVGASSGTATLLRASGGISGDFATVSGFSSGTLDYLQLSTNVSGNDYLLSYGLSWFKDESAAHGKFTVSDEFTVSATLTDQHGQFTGNTAASGWDGRSLDKHGAGTLTLSATNTYTGDTTVHAGQLHLAAEHAIANSRAVTVSGGATLSLGGFNQRLLDLTNNGLVEFVNLGRTLTVSNLTGSGTFRMDIDIHNQIADLLDVTGVSSGNHWLALDNQNGGQITGDENPLKVVQTADGGGSFSGAVNSGMFRFSATIQKGDEIDAADYQNFSADPNSWYVALTGSDTTGGNQYPQPSLSALGGAVLNTAAGVSALWFAQQDNLSKRMGDLHSVSGTRGGDIISNIWVRGFGGQADLTVSGVEKFRQTQYGVDLGTDHAWRLDTNNVLYTGVFAGYGGADRDFHSEYSGRTHSGYGGLYGTWVNGSGWYADAVAKGQYFRNEFSGDDAAKYNSVGAGASLEAGRFIKFTDGFGTAGWFIEPSLRASYLRLFNDDYTTDRGFAVSLADADVLQFYGGARLGHTVSVSGPTGTVHSWLQPYLKAGALEQVSAGGKVRASGGEWRPTADGFRFILGAGLAWQIDADNQLHFDYEADLGDRYRAPWSVNLGYLHQF